MKFNFEVKVEDKEVNIGDIVIFADGSIFLMCFDDDRADVRAVNLKENEITEYFCNIKVCLEQLSKDYGSIVKVIESDNIVLDIKK